MDEGARWLSGLLRGMIWIIPLLSPAMHTCRSKWFIPSTIIGATNMDQLKSNLKAFPGGDIRLSKEVLAAIERVHNEHRNPALQD